MSAMIVLITVPLLFLLNLIYLQFGTHFKIFAKKQDQSRRNRLVTGAGIVFLFAWALFLAFNDFKSPLFLLILFVAAIIGLIDDIWEVPLILQFAVHIILITLLFKELQLINQLPAYQIIFIIVLALLFLLVVAKHDAVNGLLTTSALVFFMSTAFVLPGTLSLDVTNPILYITFSLLAFGWFNFKQKADLFMGAAGRATLAYLMVYFMLQMAFSITTANVNAAEPAAVVFMPQFLLFVVVMVVDFMQALIRNKIAGKPFSQLPFLYVTLKEKQVSFLAITMLYGAVQLLVNLVVVYLSARG
jgi:UDP-GlcNAc:undecaprenyl-phosphate GlcNAc-1-phosphate transferase